MAMDDTRRYGSRSSPTHPRQQRYKLDVYNEVLRRLRDGGCSEALSPAFEDELWAHFNRLPARYAIDVNVERAEDVLTHKKLLQLAQEPPNRPMFDVRVVQVDLDNQISKASNLFKENAIRQYIYSKVSPVCNPNQVDSFSHNRQGEEGVQSSSDYIHKQSIHPPPAFGSSANLEALARESSGPHSQGGDITGGAISCFMRPMHEVTFSTVNKPKLLSQLTSLLAEVGLNIQEAHAFSTNDGYSLDVFVVDGWPNEETEQLRDALQKEIHKIEETCLKPHLWSPVMANVQVKEEPLPVLDHVQIPTDGTDVWEIDPRLLKFENKVASGSYGDLYRGTYCSQDVAIKVLKPGSINADMQREFAQEVYIMRKVRHKNVVQFIGACTRPPSLCIVTEFMSGGSVYDFLHKQKGVFKLPALLRVAIDVSKGMNFLHQNNIIHRDLKTANLLMDENEVVKVADFGVARVKAQSGVMTAETGTYRWMAPEVIEHKPYDHKADVFSFAIVLWELLTGKIPYEYLTPLQAAVGVVQKDLRPTIPKHTHPKLADLLKRCWQQDPALRQDFSEILEILQQIAREVGDESEDRRKSSGGFLSVLRLGH